MGVFNVRSTINSPSLLNNSVGFTPSYSSECLNFVLESTANQNMLIKNLYSSILESDGKFEVITEGFESFFASFNAVLDKFIKFIKNIIDRFIIEISKLINSDKLLLKNKEKFASFKSSDNFKFDGFRYTISEEIPQTNAFLDFSTDFFDIENPSSTIDDSYESFISKLKNNFYDKFRAQVLNAGNTYISYDDFPMAVFSKFRGNSTNPSPFTVTQTDVNAAVAFVTNYDKIITDVMHIRLSLEKEYSDIKKYANTFFTSKYIGGSSSVDIAMRDEDGYIHHGTITYEQQKNVSNFIKAKLSQITEMSNIHTLVVGYKLDAIKECKNQSRAMLYKALERMSSIHEFTEHRYSLYEAKLTDAEKKKLSDDKFGIPSKRKFPLVDEGNVKAAMLFFNTTDEEDKPILAANILKKAKELNIEYNKKSKWYEYIKEAVLEGAIGKCSSCGTIQPMYQDNRELICEGCGKKKTITEISLKEGGLN